MSFRTVKSVCCRRRNHGNEASAEWKHARYLRVKPATADAIFRTTSLGRPLTHADPSFTPLRGGRQGDSLQKQANIPLGLASFCNESPCQPPRSGVNGGSACVNGRPSDVIVTSSRPRAAGIWCENSRTRNTVVHARETRLMATSSCLSSAVRAHDENTK